MDNIMDKNYSPSQWSKRFSNADEVLQFHVNFANRESEKVRQRIKHETISYGSQNDENFDIFGTDLPPDSPIVVYIHGGYWQELNKNMSAYCVAPLISSAKVIVVEYSLCPRVTLSEIVEQMVKCGKFIMNYAADLKCRQLSFVGHSAGAHLILCMINQLIDSEPTPLKIHALFLISGIYDLRDLQRTSINKGNILTLNNSNVSKLSPSSFDYKKWSEERFTVKIYVAENDSPTFIEQSFKLCELIRGGGLLSVNVLLVESCDHFDIVEKLSEESFKIIQDIISDT